MHAYISGLLCSTNLRNTLDILTFIKQILLLKQLIIHKLTVSARNMATSTYVCNNLISNNVIINMMLHLRSSSLITTLAVLSGPATTELAAASSGMEICALKSSSHSSTPSISLVTGIVTCAVVEPLLKVTVNSPPK